MNMSLKMHHQPLNPFRTQPRGDDNHTALFANPLVRLCYAAAVGVLMIAVSVVAWTAFWQLPSARDDTAQVAGPHRLAATELADLKILQPEIRIRGAVRVGEPRIPPQQQPIEDTTSTADGTLLLDKMSHTRHDVPMPIPRPKNNGGDEDDGNKEDLLSLHHDEEEEEEEEDTNGGQDAEDLLLRPAEVHMKMLGETKEQVKQEMEHEDYSDHAFGVQQNDERNQHNDNRDDQDESARLLDRLREGADKEEDINNHEVHVLLRKGELKTFLSALETMESSTADDKGVNATKLHQAQSIVEISADDMHDHPKEGQHTQKFDQQMQPGEEHNEQGEQRYKFYPPIAVATDQ